MTNSLNFACVQANPMVGNFFENFILAKSFIKRLTTEDLIVFPECFLSGYPLEDLVRRPGFQTQARKAIENFSDFVRELNGPSILMGVPAYGTNLPYNAALLFSPDGSIRSTYKRDLPNTDVFDEVRTFTPGKTSSPMEFANLRLGVGICEEMWHPVVSNDLAGQLADILIFINGSPFEDGKQITREKIARRRVTETKLPLVYLNMIGGQDELVFDGASFAMDRDGNIISRLEAFNEGVMKLTLTEQDDGELDLEVRDELTPVHPYPKRMEAIYTAAMVSLRDYVIKNGFREVVFGMSGGLDSALVAAIATDALGGEYVNCRMMPSGFTSDESKGDAQDCADALGAKHKSIPIGNQFQAFESALVDEFDGKEPDVTEENLQARIRGTTIMALSNKFGWLPLATGNKSELSVGYATIYGDMVGGFAVIKDIYKTDVFALAAWRNMNKPKLGLGPTGTVIPENIIIKKPTAELAEGQVDEDTLGDYEVLDAVLKGLIEHELDAETTRARAEKQTGQPVTINYVKTICNLIGKAEWKRRQSPPGTKLTSRPFSKGWRYPITKQFSL